MKNYFIHIGWFEYDVIGMASAETKEEAIKKVVIQAIELKRKEYQLSDKETSYSVYDFDLPLLCDFEDEPIEQLANKYYDEKIKTKEVSVNIIELPYKIESNNKTYLKIEVNKAIKKDGKRIIDKAHCWYDGKDFVNAEWEFYYKD